MNIDVVVSAHANAAALHFTLLGFRLQTHRPHTVWVTEDGQSPEIAAVLQRHRPDAGFRLEHLHQPHQGFRKWQLVNRAIRASQAEYLVFTDADCVPRGDLLAQYAALARPRQFLAAGSHVELPQAFHEKELNDEWLYSQRVFDAAALRRHGLALPAARLLPAGWLPRMLDRLTPRSAFVGNNAGAWRSDLLRVGGFDEAISYGGGDRNLGIRLELAGVRGQRARHSLVCLHLAHPRPWRDEQQVARHKAWNQQVQQRGLVLPRQSLLLAEAAGGAPTLPAVHAVRWPVGRRTA
jgi:hypothetical protein